jgi:hypothetical protein
VRPRRLLRQRRGARRTVRSGPHPAERTGRFTSCPSARTTHW